MQPAELHLRTTMRGANDKKLKCFIGIICGSLDMHIGIRATTSNAKIANNRSNNASVMRRSFRKNAYFIGYRKEN